MTASTVIATERGRRVGEALHSGEMEGFTVDAATKVDSDELVARARARYGLD